MQAVMITMEGREDSAFVTAERLTGADISTEIFIQPKSWPVGGESNNKNSVRALAWAMKHVEGPGLLFVEDDIEIKPDRMKRALAAATGLAEVMYFYMHDIVPRTGNYPDEKIIHEMIKQDQYHKARFPAWVEKQVFPEGVRLMKKDTRMFGAQCVYIPKPYVRFLHAHMTQGYTYSDKIKSKPTQAIDTSLNNWRASNGLSAYTYLPHPVQHLQNRERREGGRRDVYSISYNIVSDLEVGDGV